MLDNDELLIIVRFLRGLVSDKLGRHGLLPKIYHLGTTEDYADYEKLQDIINKLEKLDK